MNLVNCSKCKAPMVIDKVNDRICKDCLKFATLFDDGGKLKVRTSESEVNLDTKFHCEFCGTGTDEPEKEQGLPFCHTQDCEWLIANVQPDKYGWRDTPGATKELPKYNGRKTKKNL